MALQLKFNPELKSLLQVRPPLRVKILLIKERHFKRLLELSEKSARQKPQLERPNEEQQRWIDFRMSHGNTWPKIRENKIGVYKNWK
jgi:hypothetical protein